MKRKRIGDDVVAGDPAPKRRVQDQGFRESESVRERAKPYLLAVGRLHVDVLETTWSTGRNRRVEPAHVRELTEVFMKGGLERGAPENRLFVLCSADEVRRIRGQKVPNKDHDNDDDDDAEQEVAFLQWAAVNGTMVEVMAGQHRLCALRAYVRATGTPASDSWWTCELYDKDRLPADLNIKLRINRRDPGLPDNHGQIWTQLVSVASAATESAAANPVTVDHKLVEALRLGGEKSFPTRRLVTLWNHERWRRMTTRWCQTRLGLETFNISTFEWMASLRVDEYWFSTMEAVLATLAALPLDETHEVGLDDWNRLTAAAAHAGQGKDGVDGVAEEASRAVGRDAAEAVFFTGSDLRRRTAGLLPGLDDDAYRRVYRAVLDGPDLTFVDLRRLLRSRKPETEAAVRALHHVVAWIHPGSAAELDSVNPKAKNKPQLVDHLRTALDSLGSSRGCGHTYARDAASQLQRRVLDVTRHSAEAFLTPDGRALLASSIMLVDEPAYGRRFGHGSWARLLRTVRRITDLDHATHVLRPDWDTSDASDDRGRARMLTLVSAFCTDLFRLGDRPVTSNDAALLALQRRVQQALASSAGELPGLPLLGPAEPRAREGRERDDAELEREGETFDEDGQHRRTSDSDDGARAGIEHGTRGRRRGFEKQRPLRPPPPPSAQKPRVDRSSDYGNIPSTSGRGRGTQAHDDDAAEDHTPPSSSPASRRPSSDGQRRTGATSPTPSASTNKPRPQWKTGPRARRS